MAVTPESETEQASTQRGELRKRLSLLKSSAAERHMVAMYSG